MFTQGTLSHHGGFQRGSVYKSYNDDDDGYENVTLFGKTGLNENSVSMHFQ